MKTMNLKILAASFCFFIGHSLLGQEIQVGISEEFQAPEEDIDVNDVQMAIQEAIDEYQLYATLSDKDAGGDLTTRYERGFYQLFTDEGLSDVLLDFYFEMRPEDRGTPESYVDYYRSTGMRELSFFVTGAEIVNMGRDPNSGDILATLKVDKKFAEMYNRESLEPEYSGEIRELLFNYVLYIENGKLKALISQIVSESKIIRKEDPQRYLSIYGGVGSAIYAPDLSSYWNEVHQQSALDINGGLAFSLGVELMTSQFFSNKEGKRRISPLIGLRYTYQQISANVNDLQLDDFDATASSGSGSTDYLRHVMVSEATEDITLSTIDIPLGVGIRLNYAENKSRPNYFLNIRAIPSFGIAATSEVSALGDYDGTLYNNGELSEFRILNPNSVNGPTSGQESPWRFYDVGRDENIIGEANPELSTMGLRLELSPTMYFNMTENTNSFQLLVGLDIGYQFQSNFAHKGVNTVDDESFRFNDMYQESVINQYAENLRGFTFGLRIGAYLRREVL